MESRLAFAMGLAKGKGLDSETSKEFAMVMCAEFELMKQGMLHEVVCRYLGNLLEHILDDEAIEELDLQEKAELISNEFTNEYNELMIAIAEELLAKEE